MATIRHFTKPHWVRAIIDSGLILPERSNREEDIERRIREYYSGTGVVYNPVTEASRAFEERIRRAKGDQVWFTGAALCRSAGSEVAPDCYFEFDSGDIAVRRWRDFKRSFSSSNLEAQAIISMLDRSARVMGDDPSDYWVSESAVELRYARDYGRVREQYYRGMQPVDYTPIFGTPRIAVNH